MQWQKIRARGRIRADETAKNGARLVPGAGVPSVQQRCGARIFNFRIFPKLKNKLRTNRSNLEESVSTAKSSGLVASKCSPLEKRSGATAERLLVRPTSAGQQH